MLQPLIFNIALTGDFAGSGCPKCRYVVDGTLPPGWTTERAKQIKLSGLALRHSRMTYDYLMWLLGRMYKHCRTQDEVLAAIAEKYGTSVEQLRKTYLNCEYRC